MATFWLKMKRKGNGAKAPDSAPWTLREMFSGKRRQEVLGIGWWAFAVLLAAAIWPHSAGQNALGPSGEILFRVGLALFGVWIYALPAMIAVYGWLVFRSTDVEHGTFKLLGLVLTVLALGILTQLFHPQPLSLAKAPAFYAWKNAAQFWSQMPKGLRLFGPVALPAGGVPASAAAGVLVAIFSTIGTYVVAGTLLIISLYLLEVEPYVAGFIRRFWERLHAGVKHSRSQLDYAHPAEARAVKPVKSKPPAAAPPAMPPLPERPKINISAPPVIEKPRPQPVKPPAAPKTGETADQPAETEKEYVLPSLELLNAPKSNPTLNTAYFEGMSQTLERSLNQFGVAAKVVEVCPGPVVTRYELQPSPGVKVNSILSLADDIALAMKAEHVRIEAPIPGKGAVGIEIPNQEKQIVSIQELLGDPAFNTEESVLTFAVGKDIGGKHIFGRLDAMPHLLIAGATGSGKSACVNGIISSLLFRTTPRQVKFLMIDPKRVELTSYNGIPHLKSPVITDAREAAMALRLLVKEMEARYQRFAELGVRDIQTYNQRVAEQAAATGDQAWAPDARMVHMPYIVVFIDELADLMMIAANEVETTITRLAQMARGVGIHLVLATQRPSVDVITGLIKANFPSRIAFQVSSKVDSRTILDMNGADALLGRGDMLYAPASATKPMRIQGVFISTPEVERVVKHWRQQGAPVFDPAFVEVKQKASGQAGEGGEEEDELFQEAIGWVVRAKQASTSLLQRRLKVGYSRAARLLDLMEQRGIVGPPDGSKPRKVLISPDSLGPEALNQQEE
ncbi:MAG: DNA translocase FtsK [candidate division FCPU426 bacterium]